MENKIKAILPGQVVLKTSLLALTPLLAINIYYDNVHAALLTIVAVVFYLIMCIFMHAIDRKFGILNNSIKGANAGTMNAIEQTIGVKNTVNLGAVCVNTLSLVTSYMLLIFIFHFTGLYSIKIALIFLSALILFIYTYENKTKYISKKISKGTYLKYFGQYR